MRTEDKELLLIKELCARMPYKIVCSIYREDDFKVGWRNEKLTGYFFDGVRYEFYFGESPVSVDNVLKIKPYLRPRSSMTEEEKKEYMDIDNRSYSCPMNYAHIPASDRINWLNEKMFDYNYLIPRKLAISTEEFNPYESTYKIS